MSRITRIITSAVTATVVGVTVLSAAPAAQAAPNAAFTADVNAAKAAVTAARATAPLTITSMTKSIRSYAAVKMMRVKTDSTSVTLWNPKRPAERAIFTLKNSTVSVKYTTAKLSSNDRRELELYSALTKTSELARTKSSVMFIKATSPRFARGIPVGETTARRDRAGNISIVSEGAKASVLLGDVHTKTNPKDWDPAQIAAIAALGLDPNAQYLRGTADAAAKARLRGEYEAIVTSGLRRLIVQAFDSSAKVSVSKSKQTTYYRIRSKVSPTATPGVRGYLTTTFLIRNGRISYVLLTPDAQASDSGSSVRMSINASSGTVRGLTGSVTDMDRITVRLTELRRANIVRGTGELQRFLASVVIADDPSAITSTMVKFAADPTNAAISTRLAQYGKAVEWRDGSEVLCGRLDLVAGAVIAETSCSAAGYTRS
jgi:hypothetical protein